MHNHFPEKVSVSWSRCFIPSTPGTAWGVASTGGGGGGAETRRPSQGPGRAASQRPSG